MIRLLSGDARDVLPTLPAESVQCVVTSPPYYGLRDYGTALWDGGDAGCDHKSRRTGSDARVAEDKARAAERGYVPSSNFANYGAGWTDGSVYRAICGKCGAVRVDRQIGLEPTSDEYLATMVGVFREVRRVLRRDGTCWVNMGDSYSGSSTNTNSGFNERWGNAPGIHKQEGGRAEGVRPGKPKDLLLMPARLALALQADGWWVRSDIIWHKPNPMPESTRDRPTSAHEHVFLLTRSSRYYYDADAVREEAEYGRREWTNGRKSWDTLGQDHSATTGTSKGADVSAGRNMRNVWTIATQAYSESHYATFPSALAERCIKAGTSERGCCAACGKPWVRVTERELIRVRSGSQVGDGGALDDKGSMWKSSVSGRYDTATTGWAPGCRCGTTETRPCMVLDPFSGASTTLLVAQRLQRDAIGIELNSEYVAMGRQRIEDEAGLFADVQTQGDVPGDAESETEALDCLDDRSVYPGLGDAQPSLWEWGRELAPT